MTDRTAVDLDVRRWRPEDEPAVLDLLARTLGPGPAGERSAAFFRWKHEANPFGPSLLLVAETQDRIVGLRALMRWRFELGGTSLRAVRAVDTATDPEHQGRGIFSRLTSHALELLRHDTDLVFNTPNEKSLPGYTRLGWEPVGRLAIQVRVRHPLRMARHGRHLGITDTPRRDRPEVDAPPVATMTSRVDLDRLLAPRPTTSTHLHTERTPEVFRWRYAEAPHLDYRAVGDASTGLAVFRVRPRGRLWETTVVEVLPQPGRRGAVGRLLRLVARAADTDHLTMHAGADRRLLRHARSRGFVRAPGGILLVHRAVTEPLPDPVRDPRTWDLSLGDVEVF